MVKFFGGSDRAWIGIGIVDSNGNEEAEKIDKLPVLFLFSLVAT